MCLLGLIGTPSTGVFACKLTVFTAALDADLGWLVVLAAVNSVASVFYYLRWIAPGMRAEPEPGEPPERWASVTAYVAASVSIVLDPLAGPILDVVGG